MPSAQVRQILPRARCRYHGWRVVIELIKRLLSDVDAKESIQLGHDQLATLREDQMI